MNKKYKKGSSIIEVIIYTFLSLTLLLVLTDVFSQLLNKSQESVSMSEVEVDGKFISQKIYNQIAQASGISLPANLGDTSNTFTLAINSSNYSYYLSGTNMFLNDGITIERLNSYGTTVSNLTAQRLGNPGGKPIIRISFDITSTIIQAQGNESKNYLITAGLR